ncbi:hypothetical protein L914_14678 [Phytophthora nicotianae]|uniref:Uncharacterized protein n=1 Tax=Phytophthora nicotianae TaxID=4792 RepID=W2MUG3_PHYNI|nr:hypothetical protein L914_14678 [Phytophthora nicotianae]
MALDECLASIICYQTRAEQLLYDRACKVSMVHHEGYDREMNLLANLVSKRVCSLIHEQYMYAIGSALYTFYETTPGVISIKNDAENEDSLDEPRVQYTINTQEGDYHSYPIAASTMAVVFYEGHTLTAYCGSIFKYCDHYFTTTKVSMGRQSEFREASCLTSAISESVSLLEMNEYGIA